MKTIKPLVTRLSMVCLLAVLLTGGCKKELADDSTKIKKPDLLLSKDGGPGKKKVLRQSPGLKIGVKGETIERISPTLKSIDKITSILNEEQSKKNQDGVMTTKSANFTASLAGTYYNCYAELNDPGPYDWYLINWNTGVYTYIGSSTDYINFNVQKPSMYGSYRVWGEGPYGAGFTGYQYMGDPYSGVSLSGGMLVFDDANSAEVIYNRLETAYEDHQAALFDSYDYLTDEQMDAIVIAQGYDEWLPLKEFEAYFGLSTLRQSYQSQVDAYNANSTSAICNPRNTFVIDDEIFQTMLNTAGQIQIGGDGTETLDISQPLVCEPDVCTSTGCSAKRDKVRSDTVGNIIVEKIIRQRPRHTSNLFPAVIRAKAKGKVIIFKITGATSRRPYSTKMSVRIYGQAYDGNPTYNTPTCGVSIGAYDTGFNSLRRRWQRKETHRWNNTKVWLPACGLYAQYNLPTYGTFYMNR